MSQQKSAAQPPGLNVQDVLYVLFKHKWKIITTSALGLGAAVAVYLLYPVIYESQAKLLVRYVVDTSAIDQVDSRPAASENLISSEVEILTSSDLAMEVAETIGTERLLPESEGAANLSKAAAAIRNGLSVVALPGTNIISVSYRNPDPELARLVLKEIVSRYFTKHLEVHRSADAFNFVSQQTDQVRARLNHTEEELKRLKDEAGIISLNESTALINTELANTQNALQVAKAEYAEQNARVLEMEKSIEAQEKDTASAERPTVDSQVAQRYQALIGQLDSVRQVQNQQLAKYSERAAQPPLPDQFERARQVRDLYKSARDTRGPAALALMNRLKKRFEETGKEPPARFVGTERDTALALARDRYRQQNDTGFAYQGGKKDFDTLVKEAEDEILRKRAGGSAADNATQLELVKINQMQVENLEQQLRDLEKRYPNLLAASATAVSAQTGRVSLQNERAKLAGIEARMHTLEAHFKELHKRSEQLADAGPRIEQLQRTREIEENNYKYFQASLEKARIDEALDPSKIPNISVVQSPSVALKTSRDLKKIVLAFVGGGIGLGLALAFMMELLLDRSVRRKLELETLLGIPVLLSIPYLNGRKPLRLSWSFSRNGKTLAFRNRRYANSAPWDSEHFIRPYSEAIRDRLVLYFELNGMNHKPKLVAVTDCSEGGGASTLAAGLAADLSEIGDGKVLLVDMNVGRPEIHPFFGGAPACSLTEALVGEPAPAGDNLYLAVANSPEAPQGAIIPKKFYDLIPHLKASDFDYIIFDMPCLGQTSVTLPMSRFMDKVLVVVEAERSNRDFVKRAYSELIACRASVSVIVNKVRSYAPKWLGAEG